MRGIIYKDICLFFRCLDIRVLLIAAAALAILVTKNGVYAGMLASIMVDMTVGILNVMTFEKEEKTEWEKYQRTLPVSGGAVVAGKYAAVLVTALASLALGVVMTLVVFAAYRTFHLPVLGLTALLALTIPVAWGAVSLPFCYWFNFQVSQYASILLIFPLFFTIKNFEDGMWTVADVAPLVGNSWLLAGLLALAGLFLLSLAVSTAGYCWKGGRQCVRNHL